MNPLELRYEIFKKLVDLSDERDEIKSPEMVSPVPGEPVSIRLETTDPSGRARTFTVTISEDPQAESDGGFLVDPHTWIRRSYNRPPSL
jgi:hypothetical protein